MSIHKTMLKQLCRVAFREADLSDANELQPTRTHGWKASVPSEPLGLRHDADAELYWQRVAVKGNTAGA